MSLHQLMSPLVTTCIPFGRNPLPDWAIGLATILPPMNAISGIARELNKPREEARHALAEGCIKAKSKYIFFLDDDVTVPPFVLRKLLYAFTNADPDVMAIAGIYCTKTNPAMPAIFKNFGEGPYWQWKLGSVFEVAVAPLGAMLIKTEVLDKIEKPWFKDVDGLEDARNLGLIDEPNSEGFDPDCIQVAFTDDAYFCNKIRQAGYKVLAHGGVLGMHWDSTNGTAYILPYDSYPIRTELERRWGKMRDPEEMSLTEEQELVKRINVVLSEVYGPVDLLPQTVNPVVMTR